MENQQPAKKRFGIVGRPWVLGVMVGLLAAPALITKSAVVILLVGVLAFGTLIVSLSAGIGRTKRKSGSRLTQLGVLFCFISLFFYLAAMTSQSMLLLLMAGMFFGMVAINFFEARAALRGLTLSAPRKMMLPEGGRADQPWKIENRRKRPAQLVGVESSVGSLFRITFIPGGEVLFKVPQLQFTRRGAFSHQHTRVATSFPFGLVEVSRNIPLEGEVIVYPRLYETNAPHASGFDAVMGGKYSSRTTTASGAQFAGIRPWVAGDAVKNVHWKSSAKGRGLMVKMFETELSGHLSLILDIGGGDEAKIENAIRAAGSLMFAALDEGHHLQWGVRSEGSLELIPPFSDATEILERLARITPDRRDVPLAELESLITRRSAVVLVCDNPNSNSLAWLEEKQREGRRVALYLPEGTQVESSVELIFFSGHEIIHNSAALLTR